jgi:hypothetical protein
LSAEPSLGSVVVFLVGNEGRTVTVINLDGAVILGPGSEWFWSMAQFVVVTVTLVGIYFQLRIARDANAFEQIDRIASEFESELMARYRVEILVALRDGTKPEDVPDGAAGYLANFWEKVAGLVRAGHVNRRIVYEQLGGPCRYWWAVLAPNIRRFRMETGELNSSEHHEWLEGVFAGMDRQAGVTTSYDFDDIAAQLNERVESGRGRLRVAEELRTMIIRRASPAPSSASPPAASAGPVA